MACVTQSHPFILRNSLIFILRYLMAQKSDEVRIFTTAMAIPKAVANGRELDLIGITTNILTGQASWFVAALAVAEILFISTLKIVKGNIKWMLAVCTTTFIASIWLSTVTSYCFWQIDNALMAMLFPDFVNASPKLRFVAR